MGGVRRHDSRFRALSSLGSIEITHARDWYARAGKFDKRELLAAWEAKLPQSLDRGYAGMRCSGNTTWLERNRWEDFESLPDCVFSLDAVSSQHLVQLL